MADAIEDSRYARFALRCSNFAERWFPDSWVFAALAVIIVAVATLGMGAAPTEAAKAFGDGFWSLIPFTMQMAFVVIGGYVVASSPPAVKLIDRLARIPKNGRSAVAWVALISHRMRTLLTMLGIVIGITSVVSISAIGEGAKRYVLKDIQAIGSNTIDIFPGKSFGDSRASAIETLLPSDVDALNQLYYVDSATPVVGRNLLLRYGNIDLDAQVNGVSDRYFQVKGLKLEAGITFSESDARRQAQVVVIDHNARHRLFAPGVDPLGQVILVGNLPCTVIGVTADNKNMFAASKALNVWVPYETAAGRLLGQRHLDSITVRIKDGQPSKVVEENVTKLMLQRHGTKDFFTNNLDSIMQTVQKTSRSLALLLSLIAVISLLVGGIGVMNIMLVSVTERTREIGIRMAVGARQSDIRQQFLVEAVMVCLIGGMIGISLSFAIGYLFSLFVKEWEMVFSLGSVVTAFACSTLIGIVFGFVPARNAARLDPIEALARD
ncbi:ABC transporter permease [Pseudomonas sp. K5002]|uniref:ABC transporter permease n=1 Tax=Pseudomonas sp. K5002 TaxID=2738828 RepID=UPI001810A3AE|nr:ABC transporter permease [Pseudomonas sp. K5002]